MQRKIGICKKSTAFSADFIIIKNCNFYEFFFHEILNSRMYLEILEEPLVVKREVQDQKF